MKTRNILICLGALYMALTACQPPKADKEPGSSGNLAPQTEQPASPADHQTLIDPDTKLIYTHHARCRMSCRHISEADIREVLREGHINEAKSKQEPGRCPAYAIEDERNSDHVRLRIVFAKCDNEVKVVTCIDRDDEFSCDCK